MVKSGAWYYILQTFVLYLFIHGVSQCKSCSLHLKPDFLDIWCDSFKVRLKIWMDLKTTDQVSFSEQMPHSFTVWFSLPQIEG